MTDVEAKANNKRKGHSGNQPANKKQKFGKNADGPKQKPGKKPKGNQDGVQNGAKAQQKQTQKPEKKMKQFAGTGEVQPKSEKQVQKNQQGNKSETDGEKKPKKSRYAALKGKINSGDKSVIETLDERIKAIQNRGELTKSAQRKLKVLQRMRRVATGEKVAVKESQQVGKQNKAVKGKGNQPKGKAVENAKAKAAKAKAKPAKTVTEESDEDDEFVEGATAGADSDDDEESGEEVEGESEAEDDNDEEDDDAEEDDDDAEEEDEDDESEEEEEVPKVSSKQQKQKPKQKGKK